MNKIFANKLQIDKYREDGFIHIRRLFNRKLVSDLAQESDRLELISRSSYLSDPIRFGMVKTEGGVLDPYRIDPVVDISEMLASLATSSSFKDLIDQITGRENVLLKDKLIFKKPGARGFPLHQDYAWCQSPFPRSLATVAISIDSSNLQNGCLEFLPGFNSLLSPEGEVRHLKDDEISRIDLSRVVPVPTAQGDIVLFSGFTPHQSAPNRSKKPRRMLFFSYNDRSDGNFYSLFKQHNRDYTKRTTDEDGEYIEL